VPLLIKHLLDELVLKPFGLMLGLLALDVNDYFLSGLKDVRLLRLSLLYIKILFLVVWFYVLLSLFFTDY